MNEAPENPKGGSTGRARYLGIALLALAFLMWALVPVVLLLPLSGGQKGWATAALLVVGAVALCVSAVVHVRGAVRGYPAYLAPRRLVQRDGA